MTTKLYVGGLSFSTTEEELRTFFEQAGTVQSASVVMDQFSGRSKGFGFVEMASQEEAQKAVAELNGKTLGDRTIRVEESRPSPQRGGGGGGGGGGGRRGPPRGRPSGGGFGRGRW